MATGTKTPIALPPGWTLDDEGKTIGLHVKVKDFLSAVGLINEITRLAEELDHHPDLHLTAYNHLEVRTYTHTVGSLTSKDQKLAERINALLAEKRLKPQ